MKYSLDILSETKLTFGQYKDKTFDVSAPVDTASDDPKNFFTKFFNIFSL